MHLFLSSLVALIRLTGSQEVDCLSPFHRSRGGAQQNDLLGQQEAVWIGIRPELAGAGPGPSPAPRILNFSSRSSPHAWSPGDLRTVTHMAGGCALASLDRRSPCGSSSS